MATLGTENEICNRHCSVCEGMDHHWGDYGDEDDNGEPVLSCKHCDATKPMDDDDGDDPLTTALAVSEGE